MQQPLSRNYSGQGDLQHITSTSSNSNTANILPYSVASGYTPLSTVHSPYIHEARQYPYSSQPPYRIDSTYQTATAQNQRSSTGTAYYEKPDTMAAATMQRPYPPSYHTAQTASPISVTSPHGYDSRHMMSHSTPVPQSMWHSQSHYMHPSPYGPYGSSALNTTSMLPTNYGPGSISQSRVSSNVIMNTSPQLKSEAEYRYDVTPQQKASLATQRQTPTITPVTGSVLSKQELPTPPSQTAAPGPIPATTPVVVKQDSDGVQWIQFEYSRDRVKMQYQIRCDVESVDIDSLTAEFKSENCVYPRACVPRDQYKGNRIAYETECNQVGWALAQLNNPLRGKRGLIQRAVDSWRNSNQDPRLRSRRVRRQSKISQKAKAQSQSVAAHVRGAQSGEILGSLGAPVPRLTSLPSNISHHHHSQTSSSPTLQDPSGAYPSQSPYRSQSASQTYSSSPNDIRTAHTFHYQPYPSTTPLQPSMPPPGPPSASHYGRANDYTTVTSQKLQKIQVQDTSNSALFGHIHEAKKRKFILVDDTQKNAKIRVKVSLDQVDVKEIPDSYRRNNSVFPRSFNSLLDDPPEPSVRFAELDDGEDEGPPTIGKTTVRSTLADDYGEVEVSQLTRGKKNRELKINELGYRMAWAQSRVFSNRPIFLGRALDAYRSKQRSALLASGQDDSILPSHLEHRPGKRRWLERTQSTEWVRDGMTTSESQ